MTYSIKILENNSLKLCKKVRLNYIIKAGWIPLILGHLGRKHYRTTRYLCLLNRKQMRARILVK